MKKVEIETECGEVSTIYVDQDVKSITIDGEKYNPESEDEEEKRTTVESEDGDDWAINTEWDVDGIYLKYNGFGYINIHNKDDDLLAVIDTSYLKNVKKFW